MRESPRTRRLRNDHARLLQLRAESTIFEFEASGQLAELYVLRFRGRGVSQPRGSASVVPCDEHEVHVRLGAAYPRMMPELVWISPIFHPNVSASGVVWLGGYSTHWVPSLSLDELCSMLWDIVRYRNYDVESPYNREAAAWARSQGEAAFPLDPRPIRDRISPPLPCPAVTRPLGLAVGPDREPMSARDRVSMDDEAEVIDAELVVSPEPDIVFLD